MDLVEKIITIVGSTAFASILTLLSMLWRWVKRNQKRENAQIDAIVSLVDIVIDKNGLSDQRHKDLVEIKKKLKKIRG